MRKKMNSKADPQQLEDAKKLENEMFALLPHHENWRMCDEKMEEICKMGGFRPEIDLFSCVSGLNTVLDLDYSFNSKTDAYMWDWGDLKMNLWSNSTWHLMGRTVR